MEGISGMESDQWTRKKSHIDKDKWGVHIRGIITNGVNALNVYCCHV